MIEFTGERFVPSESGEIAYEHWHRYAACASIVENKKVLDIACGEGYGTALLARTASHVVGVDIEEAAVSHARKQYADQANASYAVGDACSIPFADGSFDVVVSFETLEHLEDQDGMLAEITRVLTPQGLLVISSPDKHNYSDARNYHNPFHVKELYFSDLDRLLRAHFKSVDYYGQRMSTGSLIASQDGDGDGGGRLQNYVAYLARDGRVVPGVARANQAMYFMAVCSPAARPLPKIQASMLFDDGVDLYSEQEVKIRWAMGLSDELEDRTKWAKGLEAELHTVREELQRARAFSSEIETERDNDRAYFERSKKELEERAAWVQSAGGGGGPSRDTIEKWGARLAETESALASLHDLYAAQRDGMAALRREEKKGAARDMAASQVHIENLGAVVGGLRHREMESNAERERLNARIDALSSDLSAMSSDLDAIGQRAAGVRKLASGVTAALGSELASERVRMVESIRRLQQERDAIADSAFWRLTRPLRVALHFMKTGQRLHEVRYLPDPVADGEASFHQAMGVVENGLTELAEACDASVRRIDVTQAPADPADSPGTVATDAGLDSDNERDPVAGLEFPVALDPVVSIIVPTYGNVELSAACLHAIMRNPPAEGFEVILAEDASGDAGMQRFSEVPGLRYEPAVENHGFVRNCNRAARLAKGKFLLFLNNDTEVLPGAVEELLGVFREKPDCGLAGSMLLNTDGSVQEAGGIVWNDAGGWNYGRGGDASSHEFNYLREVDYCSGACLMVPSALFAQLGMFDERYAPAYYEDTDLAFKVREAGLKVFYVPGSKVVHHEGGSHGTDPTVGVKAYQGRNQQLFLEKWKDRLAEQFPNSPENVFLARDRARDRPLVLVIDHYVPQPDRDAGSRVMIDFMDSFIELGAVVKFWPYDMVRNPVYARKLERDGIEVVHTGIRAERFREYVRQHGKEFDVVLLSRPEVAMEFIDDVKEYCTAAKVLFFGHDLHSARLRRQFEVSGTQELLERAESTERTERAIWSQVDLSLYPSEEEAAEVLALAPGTPVDWVPLVSFDRFAERIERHPEGRSDILFVAGFAHPPNVDAALWLVNEIFPKVRRSHPGVRLRLVGSNPTAEVMALAANDVEVTGFVSAEELALEYRRARVVVAPLRFGAGVKLKVLEAMRYGVPLVTTPIGAQGLDGLDAHACVATGSDGVSECLLDLLRDDGLWRRNSDAGLEYVQRRFPVSRMREAIRRVSGFDGDGGRAALARSRRDRYIGPRRAGADGRGEQGPQSREE